jgi:molybdopterin-guanine dinucleotide biosynthesis protein A
MRDANVLILAGGEATRLPGKLALPAGGVPLLARVYRNLAPGRSVRLALNGALPRKLDELLPIPATLDRWPRRGPLGGMLSAFADMRARWVFAVAGDAPYLDARFLEELEAARRPGDEAIVPVYRTDGRDQVEPLAALYDRPAFLREGYRVLRSGNGGPRAVLERLRVRHYPVASDARFASINTPADYARFGDDTDPKEFP